MGKSIKWYFSPYRPFLFNSGDIYICRMAPAETSIHFEWLADKNTEYEVYYKATDEEEFTPYGSVLGGECTIEGLKTGVDYELYVKCGKLKSRVRLARTGYAVGTVVNYIHPKDGVYGFSGNCLCSPSLVRHPDGYLLSSMDVFAPTSSAKLTLIFRSDDNGKTWHYVNELFPCFWGKMFINNGALYMLGCTTDYGDLLIGRSDDGGKTFTEPTALLRGSGDISSAGIHKNPQNVVHYKGRIYETFEWGGWCIGYHAVAVMSCDENADLLNVDNWHFTYPLKYNPEWEGTFDGPSSGNIEGTLAIAPDGRLLNIMRYDTTKTTPNYGRVLAYEVNLNDPDASLIYSHAIDLPGNLSKFMIKYDDASKKYYTIISRITGADTINARTILTLMCSPDLEYWEVVTDIYDLRNEDPKKVGVQYVDFEIEGDDIIFLCRTGMNNAENHHNTNYQTFDRISNFRNLCTQTNK